MRRKLRIVNAAFWIVAWIATVIWTKAFGELGPMALEALALAMIGAFIHIALRAEPGA